MLSDSYEQALAQILNAGLPAPGPDCEARVLATLAGIRPRRHPNLVTIIIVAALVLLLAAGVFAAARYFFYVEGTLEFHDARYYAPDAGEAWAERARFFSGELQWQTEPDVTQLDGDISPDGSQVVFAQDGGWPPGIDSTTGIVLSSLDGSDQVNLTESAGIGGHNCVPKWSPDGTMIAFVHCDLVEGLLPCDAGQFLWVMNADGSDAHRVTPEGAPPITNSVTWSPDSSRLAASWRMQTSEGELITRFDQPTDTVAFTTDIWGTDIRPLPNVGYEIAWSPDGSMLVSTEGLPKELDGKSGAWTQLIVTDADGGRPRVLVEHFVSHADALAHRNRYPGDTAARNVHVPDAALIADVEHWAGPCTPVWSPNSDKIAFLAAMPFDPQGPYFKDQIEVWVYDLTTDEVVQVTDDEVGQTAPIWK